MSKRKKFVISSLVLSLGFISIQVLDLAYRFWAIGSLSIITLILFVWSLKEGLGRDATLLVLILPCLFTLSVGLFWFLIPATVFARLPVLILYAVGIYALSLTMNIFTVSSIRTIALSRAAKGVGFVLTLLTFFLMYDTIISLKTGILVNALLVSIISLPLFIQGLWSSSLEKKISMDIFVLSLVFNLVIIEVIILLYFWPVTVVVGSLFLTTAGYILLGLGQAKIEAKLFSQTYREYLVVGILVFIGMFLATSWRG